MSTAILFLWQLALYSVDKCREKLSPAAFFLKFAGFWHATLSKYTSGWGPYIFWQMLWKSLYKHRRHIRTSCFHFLCLPSWNCCVLNWTSETLRRFIAPCFKSLFHTHASGGRLEFICVVPSNLLLQSQCHGIRWWMESCSPFSLIWQNYLSYIHGVV